MAGLILCKSEEAVTPYYIQALGVNVYSLEELCYSIYSNIYLLTSDFLDDGLIEFVKKDLKDARLSNELKFLKEKKASLREIVITILLYADYYTKKEIDDIRTLIDKISTLSIEERLKRRADNFLANNMMESAIKTYTLILNEEEHVMKDDFYGDVFHNIGVAYGRLFFFDRACECFKMAYDLNYNEESLKEYFMAAALAGVKTEEELAEHPLKSASIAQMDAITNEITMSDDYIELSNIAKLRTDGKYAEYNQKIANIFDKWKAKYIAYTK